MVSRTMSFQLPDNMPELNLRAPSERGKSSGIELNDSLLSHWIKRLPQHDLLAYTETYLETIKRFNRNAINHKLRLHMLDLYRQPLNSLLFSLTIPKLAASVASSKTRLQIITNLAELMDELAMGYKIVINDANDNSANLKLNIMAQLAINRASEQLSYMALHAYKFYQVVPIRVFKELHQLYQLALHANVVDKIPSMNKQQRALFSLHHRYSQILLVSICNPYGLESGKVLEAYFMMDKLVSTADIWPLPDNHQATSGHFFINCLSDRTPTPTVLPTIENQIQPPTLIFDTKPVLNLADTLFQQSESSNVSINLELFKQLVPFLNTSYQRKQERLPLSGDEHAFLAFGLADIHHCLHHIHQPNNDNNNATWQILNKNNYGYLIKRQHVSACHDLKIGDFVGIFEQQSNQQKSPPKLASIKWLRTDHNNVTKIGLETLDREVIALHFSLQENGPIYPALLLPEVGQQLHAASIITAPGRVKPQQTLYIKTKKKRFNFTIQASQLIDNNENFERFTFIDILD